MSPYLLVQARPRNQDQPALHAVADCRSGRPCPEAEAGRRSRGEFTAVPKEFDTPNISPQVRPHFIVLSNPPPACCAHTHPQIQLMQCRDDNITPALSTHGFGIDDLNLEAALIGDRLKARLGIPAWQVSFEGIV